MKYAACWIILGTIFISACAENAQRAPDSLDTAAGGPASVDSAVLDAASAPADALEWTAEQVSVDRSVHEPAVVDEFRTGRHQSYERFVIEFQNDVTPGYDVGYITEPPIECGSGRAIELQGNAVLEVRLEPARGHDEQGQPTVDHGERRFELPLLRESEVSCDFEAMFTVLLGLEQRMPFHVSELRDPARLVVDVRHAEE